MGRPESYTQFIYNKWITVDTTIKASSCTEGLWLQSAPDLLYYSLSKGLYQLNQIQRVESQQPTPEYMSRNLANIYPLIIFKYKIVSPCAISSLLCLSQYIANMWNQAPLSDWRIVSFEDILRYAKTATPNSIKTARFLLTIISLHPVARLLSGTHHVHSASVFCSQVSTLWHKQMLDRYEQ